MKTIPYGRQSINQQDIDAVVEVLKSDYLTQGPAVEHFEKKLAEYCGTKHALVFNSGTSALHGAYFSLNISVDDEVITSPITFVATSNAALYLGAKPVFADVNPQTGNICPKSIENKITAKTKLIVPVHYGGLPVDMEKVSEIAAKHNLFVVEDASHALGAEVNGEKCMIHQKSDMAILSFHPVKHITSGEGGAIITNNTELYERAKQFRTHGITKETFENKSHGDWYYEMQSLGFNYRMTDVHAALGASQLARLDAFVARRREIAKIYDVAFADCPYLTVQKSDYEAKSAYHLYPILLNDKLKPKRKEIFEQLRASHLWVQVHYIPVHLQPYYQKLGYKKGYYPNAEDFYDREISIPMYPAMTDEDVNYVIETVLKILKGVDLERRLN